MLQTGPVHFWDAPAFTTALELLVLAVIGALQVWVAAKVKTIETHTNGMLTSLQTKVDAQNTLRETTATDTQKNIEIALLKKP
jgi:hypothetical protein